MSILTRDKILEEIRAEKIKIEPFDEEMVGPASVDLHLGNQFLIFRKVHEIVNITDRANHESVKMGLRVSEWVKNDILSI